MSISYDDNHYTTGTSMYAYILLHLRRIQDRCLGVDLVPRSHITKISHTQNSQIKQRFVNTNLNFIYRKCTGDEEAYKGKNKNSNTWAEVGESKNMDYNQHEMYFCIKV